MSGVLDITGGEDASQIRHVAVAIFGVLPSTRQQAIDIVPCLAGAERQFTWADSDNGTILFMELFDLAGQSSLTMIVYEREIISPEEPRSREFREFVQVCVVNAVKQRTKKPLQPEFSIVPVATGFPERTTEIAASTMKLMFADFTIPTKSWLKLSRSMMGDSDRDPEWRRGLLTDELARIRDLHSTRTPENG